jgi:hypothetical protein
LASWLGGSIPVKKEPEPQEKPEKDAEIKAIMGEPDEEATQLPIIPSAIRAVIGIAGLVLLAAAFVLVFSSALALLRNGSPPIPNIPTINDLLKGD